MRTLNEIVQDLMSSLDSDEVNSIHDTVESVQVARIVRGVFYDCASDLGLERHEGLFELLPSNDPNKPVIMYVPSNVYNVYWVKYNTKLNTDTHSSYVDMKKIDFLDFFEKQSSLTEDGMEEFVYSINGEPYEFRYLTNKMPTCYSTLTSSTLIFDSFDINEDSTLVKNKTMCGGLIYPEFLMEDSFIIPVDPQQLSYLINKAKVRCFNELKQVENREAAGEARRQKIAHQRTKNRTPEALSALQRQHKLTGYGR